MSDSSPFGPRTSTAIGAGFGSLAGVITGNLFGGERTNRMGLVLVGSILGGVLGAAAGAPSDRRGRAQFGGGLGGVFGPLGAAAGGAIATGEPDRHRNKHPRVVNGCHACSASRLANSLKR